MFGITMLTTHKYSEGSQQHNACIEPLVDFVLRAYNNHRDYNRFATIFEDKLLKYSKDQTSLDTGYIKLGVLWAYRDTNTVINKESCWKFACRLAHSCESHDLQTLVGWPAREEEKRVIRQARFVRCAYRVKYFVDQPEIEETFVKSVRGFFDAICPWNGTPSIEHIAKKFENVHQLAVSLDVLKHEKLVERINAKTCFPDKARTFVTLDSAQLQASRLIANYTKAHDLVVPKTVSYSGGDVYQGYFLNGLKHGQGKYTWTSGNVYDGEWRQGNMHGKGKMVYASGAVYEGQFDNDERTGLGKMSWPNGDSFNGDFIKGQMKRGTFVWSNGLRYNGSFSQGCKDGYGILYESNGVIYKGNWVKNKKEGLGKLCWPDGSLFEGTFKNDQQIEGTLYYLDGNAEPWKCS